MLLKKSEHLTVAEMSREMGITSMAVRQHLMSLEKRGIIHYTTRKYGIGRPVFLYKLTDKAHDFFPKSYGSVLSEFLSIVERLDGRKKIRRIFQERKDRILRERLAAIGSNGTTEERVRALASILDKDGYMIELDVKKDSLELREYNCPIYTLVGDYQEACLMELDMYRQLFGQKVERMECQRDGSPACVYMIPK